MFQINAVKCTGCGLCVNVCPQKAIAIQNNVAAINQDLCLQCGKCSNVCTVGAIGELLPAYTKPVKGGEKMTYRYGRGFGFRGSSPAWPYVGRGRGGLPRCWHPGLWEGVAYAQPTTYWPVPGREEELGLLKDQADAMKSHLEDIEARIKELEKKE